MSILESSFFDTRRVSLFHTIQLIIIIAIIIVTIYRMTMPGVKGILVIQYQILTQKAKRLRQFANYKLFAIFNVMEVVGWGVATVFQFLSIKKVCIGTSCTLQWVEVTLSIIVFIVAQQPAVSTTLDFLHRRNRNTGLAQEPILPSGRNNGVYVAAGNEMGNLRDTSPYNQVHENGSACHGAHGGVYQSANADLSGQGQIYYKP
ncbi:uncharacterized protein DNG_06361 [Cephalotrichum gorgonifer]|uniref:Uncharacterized protein n=1 Tax=Cephalotrichum gorgonifer TaxID=2041049 RepID=A0AAE8N1E8_9PEZI|nr:uncharacterized protein DNG_06361 [Cephalotrichum gorgonifer]